MPILVPRRSLEPFFADPLSEIRRELDQVFERFLGEGFGPPSRMLGGGELAPQIDMAMEGDKLKLEVDLPGVNPEDVEVILQEGMLTIKGERRQDREETEGGMHLRERRFGRFERRLRLPEGTDEQSVEARFDKGVLLITARMREGVGQQRRIRVAGGKQGEGRTIEGEKQAKQAGRSKGAETSRHEKPEGSGSTS